MEIDDLDDDLLLDSESGQHDYEETTDNDVDSGWVKASEEDEENDNEEDDLQENDLDYEDYTSDAISSFLKDNGIDDPSRIKFSDEEGNILERAWEDLNENEKLNILRSNQREPEEGLDDDEIEFINALRANGLSPALYLQLIQSQMLSLILLALTLQLQQFADNIEPTYTSDLLTDDELFVLDLQSRVPDITDEELELALINAKSNDELYAKLMTGIRSEYQRLEQETRERDEAIQLLEYLELYNQFANTIVGEINNLLNIGDLDISMDNEEMNELADFILTQDETGLNYFNKALLDPQTLVLMAWFALHGEELFDGISLHYAQEIENARLEGYYLGLNQSKPSKRQLADVVYQPKKDKPSTKSYKDLSDLDD